MSHDEPRPAAAGPRALFDRLWSRRFVTYGLVGLSGVAVNLGAFFVLGHLLGLHRNLASALAIELSILSNFALHDRWTFRDRQGETGAAAARFGRFQGVSLVGLLVQLSTFVAANALLFVALWPAPEVSSYFDAGTTRADIIGRLWRLVLVPPPVGRLDLLSQLAGIGLGTLWNFLVNEGWTWRRRGG